MNSFSDPLYKNSFFLILTVGTISVIGFFFWVLSARLYPPSDVGIAAAAIALAQLISTFSSLGFDIGSIKFVYEFEAIRVLRTSLTVVVLVSFFIALIVTFFAKEISEKTAEILVFPFNIYFILLAVAMSVTKVLRGGAFVAIRNTKNSFIQEIFSIFRIFALPILVFTGAVGILLSFSLAPIMSALIGLYLLKKSGYSFKIELDFDIIRNMFSYSFGNYISVIFEALPGFLLPILVVNILGAKENAYFYVAWAIASLLISIPKSTSMSLFAECSFTWKDVREKILKAIKFVSLFIVPSIAFIYFAGGLLLSFFGGSYSCNSLELLRILALAAIPYSVNVIYTAICRARKIIHRIILIFFVISSVTLSAGYFLLKLLGLIGAGYAWLSGNLVSSIIVMLFIIKDRNKDISYV